MRKYKGFFVLRPDANRNHPLDALNTRQHACMKSNFDDCEVVSNTGSLCKPCLFYCYSGGEQKKAFSEWFKAKGKVEYDKAA